MGFLTFFNYYIPTGLQILLVWPRASACPKTAFNTLYIFSLLSSTKILQNVLKNLTKSNFYFLLTYSFLGTKIEATFTPKLNVIVLNNLKNTCVNQMSTYIFTMHKKMPSGLNYINKDCLIKPICYVWWI